MKRVVVDGNNVAYDEKDAQGRPRLKNILTMIQALKRHGYARVIVLVSAKLKYYIDEPQRLALLLANQSIREVPAGSDDDRFIIHTARQLEGRIVSNDLFREYTEAERAWIQERQLKFRIIEGTVIFEELEPYTPPDAKEGIHLREQDWTIIYEQLAQAFEEAKNGGVCFLELFHYIRREKKEGRLNQPNRRLNSSN
ncbi:MAG: hypothetical protein ACFFC7_11000 [Candidatus Hermodarchaeota archaeon]